MHALDFGLNTNPFGPPKRVFRDLAIHLPRIIGYYADAHTHPAHRALASFLQVPRECVTLTCGASEAIFILPRLLRARSGIIFPPTFWEYRASLERVGAKIVQPTQSKVEHAFRLTQEVIESVNSPADLAFVANPDNPTSRLCRGAALRGLLLRMGDGTLIVDETYLLFRNDFHTRSLMQVAVEQSNIITIGSLSKFFSVPGLRVGYVVAHPSVTKCVRQSILCYSVNNIALLLLERLLAERDFIRESRVMIAQERQRVCEAITPMRGFQVVPPDANFILVTLSNGSESALRSHCERNGVRPRWGAEIDMMPKEAFRVAVRDPKSNQRFLDCLTMYSRGKRKVTI